MIILLTSLKDADKYLADSSDGLKDAHVTCAFPVDAVVFFWLLRNTAKLIIATDDKTKLLAKRYKEAQL